MFSTAPWHQARSAWSFQSGKGDSSLWKELTSCGIQFYYKKNILERQMYNREIWEIIYFLWPTVWISLKSFNSSCSYLYRIKIQNAIDSKKYSCGIFIDFCVRHTLLDKLEYCCVSGIPQKMVFSNRSTIWLTRLYKIRPAKSYM